VQCLLYLWRVGAQGPQQALSYRCAAAQMRLVVHIITECLPELRRFNKRFLCTGGVLGLVDPSLPFPTGAHDDGVFT
jgi:hypothetical protein